MSHNPGKKMHVVYVLSNIENKAQPQNTRQVVSWQTLNFILLVMKWRRTQSKGAKLLDLIKIQSSTASL
jgi:hypothetical protein